MPGNGTAIQVSQHQNYFSLSGAEYALQQRTIIPSKAYLLNHQAKLVDLVDRNLVDLVRGEGSGLQKSRGIIPNSEFLRINGTVPEI